jgi:hypothetical protein
MWGKMASCAPIGNRRAADVFFFNVLFFCTLGATVESIQEY